VPGGRPHVSGVGALAMRALLAGVQERDGRVDEVEEGMAAPIRRWGS